MVLKMKLKTELMLCFLLVMTILLAGCDSDILLKAEAKTMDPLEVTLDYDVKPAPNRKLFIQGETNLPTETNLSVRVWAVAAKYDMKTDIKVFEGRFQSPDFHYNKSALTPGVYLVTVTMPVSTLQPVTVRDVIGVHGENIAGKLVRRYNDLGASIQVRQAFDLKSDGEIVPVDPEGLR